MYLFNLLVVILLFYLDQHGYEVNKKCVGFMYLLYFSIAIIKYRLLPKLTFVKFPEVFRIICDGCAMPTEDNYSPETWPYPFWNLHMLNS